MILLGINTTGDALLIGKLDQKVATIQAGPGKPHSINLLPLINRLLAGRKPDAIVVSTGPGSYTGTRIGVTIANTLGWAWKVPVYGIPFPPDTDIHKLLMAGKKQFDRKIPSTFPRPLYSMVVPKPPL